MTDFEKLIYNKFVAVTRSKQNKPFKLRQNFQNFEKEQAYVYVKKLSIFFNKYKHINIDDFFAAPFDLYEEPGDVYIDYYTTRAAIKTYSLAQKKKEELSPEKLHTFIKDSLAHIGLFCIQNNIPVSQYLYHKTGCTLSWMQHFKQRKISLYSIIEANNLVESINSVPVDERDLFLENIHNTVAAYRNRYYNSPSTVNLVREGMKKISTFVENSIKQQNLKTK